MKNLKKILTLSLVVVTLFILAACGKNDKPTSKANVFYAETEFVEPSEHTAETWKSYVVVKTESDKKIKSVYFSKFSGEGLADGLKNINDVRSLKFAYGNVFADGSGNEWFQYSEMFEKYYVENYKGEVLTAPDAISGMSKSFFDSQKETFFSLVKKALESKPVEKGNFEDGFYYIQDEEYTEESAPGSKDDTFNFVQVLVVNGRAVSAHANSYYNHDNKITTKAKLKEDYNMKKYGQNVKLEYYQQLQEMEKKFLEKQDQIKLEDLKASASVSQTAKFEKLFKQVPLKGQSRSTVHVAIINKTIPATTKELFQAVTTHKFNSTLTIPEGTKYFDLDKKSQKETPQEFSKDTKLVQNLVLKSNK